MATKRAATKAKRAKKAEKARKAGAKKAPAKKTRVAAKKRAAAARPRKVPARAKKAKKASAVKKASAAGKATKAKKASAAKRAAARPVAKTPAARRTARNPRQVQRRNHAGHFDPKYAAELLAKSGGHEAEPSAFVERPRSQDDLVEELGEEFVEEATSAEHEGEDVLNQQVPEERGGPFVETRADQEFAHGTDASNPKGAKPEPFPKT